MNKTSIIIVNCQFLQLNSLSVIIYRTIKIYEEILGKTTLIVCRCKVFFATRTAYTFVMKWRQTVCKEIKTCYEIKYDKNLAVSHDSDLGHWFVNIAVRKCLCQLNNVTNTTSITRFTLCNSLIYKSKLMRAHITNTKKIICSFRKTSTLTYSVSLDIY